MDEPRFSADYSERQTEAARRVLVDVGQVLASFTDSIVLVGGWVPDLLIPEPGEHHVGSIDVDLALDAEKLMDGRYAELLSLLLDTRRYEPGEKAFQLFTMVDLKDGEDPIRVDVDFLAPQGLDLRVPRSRRRLKNFRVQQADGCAEAFHAPQIITIDGRMLSGAKNSVEIRVASLPDFLLMKCFALNGRDKPKDAYDICYCLEHAPGGVEAIAEAWNRRSREPNVMKAIEILRQKFRAVDDYGPVQVVEFHQSHEGEEAEIEARRAFELVQKLLGMLR
jgi:hypothetical protein